MTDLLFILQWWIIWLILGIIALPLTLSIFPKFIDGGYIFSKIVSLLIIGYSVFLLGIFHIAPFSHVALILSTVVFAAVNGYILYKRGSYSDLKKYFSFFVWEEILFLLAIITWSFVRGHEPSINGLEKFMDYGFVNSALRSEYFPPKDMWFSGGSINYYYFGHYLTALITKLSLLPSAITYNLMLSTLFAFTFTQVFSICLNVVHSLNKSLKSGFIAGILGGMLASLGGNLHTLYAFFTAYNGEKPVPFWTLTFKPFSLFTNGYWYPNATRFIPFTIHEFPLYSFVVSDLHGHVLDIPFVLFIIAYLFTRIIEKNISWLQLIFISFVLSVMYMTNAWDSAIYLLLVGMVILYVQGLQTYQEYKSRISPQKIIVQSMIQTFPRIVLVLISFVIFILPFNMHFSPPVSGIGVICAPQFLTEYSREVVKDGVATTVQGQIGPFLFEKDHCTHSPLYMILILYGFFFFFAGYFIYRISTSKKLWHKRENIFIAILIMLSLVLIIIPELIYVKDIYPQHYRANTMFKLVYQSFIMFSIVSAIVTIAYIKPTRNFLLYGISILLITLVLIYPRFAVYSYYGDLKEYKGLNGITYMKDRLADDYKAIEWIQLRISGQPIILEAQGDSYTDYGRISANTGLPTVLGWTVHEWLWRGSYDVPAPRIEDIKKIYESSSLEETKQLLRKYNVDYVYIGNLEREKYPNIQAEKFRSLGEPVYMSSNVVIYKL